MSLFALILFARAAAASHHAPLTGQGMFTIRKTRPYAIDRASQTSWNATWASTCSTAERALDLKWTSLSEDLVDIITERDELGSLAGLSMLLLGDSLMLQTGSAVEWVFPDFVKVTSTLKGLMPEGSCLTARKGYFAGKTKAFTIHVCRNNQFGTHFAATIGALFKRSLVDIIVLNTGLWYNLDPYTGTKAELTAARENARLGLGWTPLGRDEYIADLKLFSEQLAHHQYSHGNDIPLLVWVETTPSHFLGGTFGAHAKEQHECVHFTASEYLTSYWRNNISEELVTGAMRIPTVRHASHLASLHFSHVHTTRGAKISVDCTHWCNPGIVPLHTLTLVLNKVLTIVSEAKH